MTEQITEALIEKYQRFVGRVTGDSVGVLKYPDSESLETGREALKMAAQRSNRTGLIARKPPNTKGVLEFRFRENNKS